MKYRSNSRLSPEYVLLGFLYRHPGHGYELHRRLKEDFGNIWHASQSQTYSILKRLEGQGYITSTNVDQLKLPPRQLLHINETGLKRFTDWLMQPTKSSVHAIRVEFVTRLYFLCLYDPANTLEMIRVQIDVVEAGQKELRGDLTNLPESQLFERLALELRIQLINSVIIWLKDCQIIFAAEQSSRGISE